MNVEDMRPQLGLRHYQSRRRACSSLFYFHITRLCRSYAGKLNESLVYSKNPIGQVDGWILDLYQKDPFMIVWLKTRNGRTVRLVDVWQPVFYVAGEYGDLVRLADQLHVEGMGFEKKFVRPQDDERSIVLRIPVRSVREAEELAEKVLIHGQYRRYGMYNVDVNPSQSYLYEKGLYPFGYVEATVNQNHVDWRLCDNLESTNYEIPPLQEVKLSVRIRRKSRLPAKNDPIEAIIISSLDDVHHIDGCDEEQILLHLVETMKTLDPDIVLTHNGDGLIFPYLAHRAAMNNISNQLILGREQSPLQISHEKGRSYMSYGQVHYRPMPTRLLGRLHVDVENSILHSSCGLPGIIEVARMCRIPAQRACSTTIGTSMTSAQFYQAFRQEILIPWQKANSEELKTASELLVADRGGFYYEPTVGLHESVGELDFTSLYPTIMYKRNLSGETVRCKCCPDSKNRVPDLNWNICEKRKGIVPLSLELLLEKRRRYKELKQTTTDHDLCRVYEMRQAALKWILVCSFGYLGFKNARFGRIDAHIATCAFARKILRDAVHLAETQGFTFVHGIVDSLWLKKPNATEEDFQRLRAEIEKATGFPITFEGLYRWIVFLPSKIHRNVPTLTRYYGVFKNGKTKVRGIATRRRDTPPIIDRCVKEILLTLAEAKNTQEFLEKLPFTYKIMNKYLRLLRSGNIPVEDLVIQKRLSKNPKEYKHMVLQAIAANQLAKENAEVNAGQFISFVITSNRSKLQNNRVLAFDLCRNYHTYDAEAYINLLLSAVETILTPFGFDKTRFS